MAYFRDHKHMNPVSIRSQVSANLKTLVLRNLKVNYSMSYYAVFQLCILLLMYF